MGIQGICGTDFKKTPKWYRQKRLKEIMNPFPNQQRWVYAFKNTLANPSKWNARYLYGNVCWVLAANSRLMSANIPDLEVIPKCRFSSAHIVGYSQVDFFSRTVTTCRNNLRSIARRIWVSDSNILCSKLWGTDSPLLA